MKNDLDFTNRPHVFILGAGATMAAIPHGDKNGKESSVMDGFIERLGLGDLLSSVALYTSSNNLEDIYSELNSREECNEITDALEKSITEYFKSLELPDTPTVYDYLLLSLRSKDYVFSFNWDSLLIQAYNRVHKITDDLPQIHFLHGNVGAAFCPHCKIGLKVSNKRCFRCGGDIEPTPLLFPVKNKDYHSNPYISGAWELFYEILPQACVLTVFGYGAPKSDSAAIEAMQKAFSMDGKLIKYFDSIELIDIKSKNELYASWESFIDTVRDHVKIYDSLFDTLIGEFPRRSIEGYTKRNYQGWWGESTHQLKEGMNFEETKNFFKVLIDKEENGDFNVI